MGTPEIPVADQLKPEVRVDPDNAFMEEAIKEAAQCDPLEEKIPRVGAVIVAEGRIIGRGRRGKNCTDDDQHAEQKALSSVKPEDVHLLKGATLYTTLEPCTPASRSQGEKCCSELIYQSKFARVLIGIMDPNPDVTGKGVLRLQETNVDFGFFPHGMRQHIQTLNGEFMRSQKLWGPKILSPEEGAYLKTFETAGRYPVQFSCTTSPGEDNFLFTSRNGFFSPQPGPFRHVKDKVWEGDAFFGTTGHHALHLVTANTLGKVLIDFYWKVVNQHLAHRDILKGKIDIYPAIKMNGFPKGLRLESSVPVIIGTRIDILSVTVSPLRVRPSETLKIAYELDCGVDIAKGAWLGAGFNAGEKFFHAPNENKHLPLKEGKQRVERNFTIPADAPAGAHMLRTNVWLRYGEKDFRAATTDPTRIEIAA